MWKRIQRFLRSEDGPTAVEYAVMLALIVMVCFASIFAIGETTSDMFTIVEEEAFANIDPP